MPLSLPDSRRVLLAAIGTAPDLTLVVGPGNRGDELIREGTRRLLDGHVYREVDAADIASARGETALIVGSGAWSRHYHEVMPSLLAVVERRFDQVIVLPSSYDVAEDAVASALMSSRALFFAREEESFRRIRGMCRAAIAHDCAMFVDLSSYRTGGEGTLHAMRTDRESARRVPMPPDNDDISATADSLQSWLDMIARHREVVTDRAHVMIAAALMGRTVRYTDCNNGKVSALARTLPSDVDVTPLPLEGRPPVAVDPVPPVLRRLLAADHALADRGAGAVEPAPVPRVGAVVLSRNRPETIRRCVESLTGSRAGVRITVVDNNSDSTTRRVLQDLAESPLGASLDVRLSDRNLGCAGGRSLGVQRVDEEFVLFLDDDAELLPGSLDRLVAQLDDHPQAQAVTSHVLTPDGVTEHLGGSLTLDSEYARFTLDGEGLEWDDPALPPSGRCDWAPGTACLIRRSALDICPIDTSLASYYEDNDWAIRMRRAFADPFRRCREAWAIHSRGHRPEQTAPLARSRFLAARAKTLGRFLEIHDRLLESGAPESQEILAGTGLAHEPAAARLLQPRAVSLAVALSVATVVYRSWRARGSR